jgi:hypothetical protein
METSLHRSLKTQFAQPGAQYEARLGRYRIDVRNPHELVEIQHGSLAAIRQKVANLVVDHAVRVVKPLVARKTLVRLATPTGPVEQRRLSPRREQLLEIFSELIYFRAVFPHPQLTVEVPLVEMEEWRFPGHGRRRRWRQNDFQVADQLLVRVLTSRTLRTTSDLLALLPPTLPPVWHTGELASLAGISRGLAQRIAYCLRHVGAVSEMGKRGNARLYRSLRHAA